MTNQEKQILLQKKCIEQIQKILKEHFKISMSIPQIRQAIENGDDFWFSRNASANEKMDEILKDTFNKIQTVILTSIQKGYDFGKASYAENVNKVLKGYATEIHRTATAEKYATFDKPKFSERVWDFVKYTKKEIEIMAQNAIKQGMSADDLAKEIRQYLKKPNELFRRVRNKETGELELSEAAKKYNPGRGVYRSSYKNAMRLARTEINAAYREAEWQSCQDDPLVVGLKIMLSNNHTCLNPKTGKPEPFFDICDELMGTYPKTFKWKGWHPQCRCVMIPVVCNLTEFGKYVRRENNYLPKQIDKMPSNFDVWYKKNGKRIDAAKTRGTQPYFVTDNPSVFS